MVLLRLVKSELEIGGDSVVCVVLFFHCVRISCSAVHGLAGLHASKTCCLVLGFGLAGKARRGLSAEKSGHRTEPG